MNIFDTTMCTFENVSNRICRSGLFNPERYCSIVNGPPNVSMLKYDGAGTTSFELSENNVW